MLQAADWEERYRSGEIPWEKGQGSPGLEDFLREHPELARGRVLVPGCGTGHDARTWARYGFQAIGMDLAPSGVRLAVEATRAAGLTVEYRVGDFLSEPVGEPFDWVFEHTLFCAIDPGERERYVEAVRRCLRPGGQFLAVHYMLRDMDGPPFGCNQPELMERFGGAFELIRGWVPNSYPNRTGLELMLWWRRRAE